MAKPPPEAVASVRIPIRISLAGNVDPDRVAAVVGDKLDRQLDRAFTATSDLGTPRLGSAGVKWTGIPPAPDHKAAVETAMLTTLVQKVQSKRGAAQVATKPAKGSSAKPAPAKRPLRAVNTWHEFAMVGDAEFQEAFALALGMRYGDAAHVPDGYGVMFRLRGIAALQLHIVIGRQYVLRWGLTDPDFLPSHQDKAASVDAGTGQFSLDLVDGGVEIYKQKSIERAEEQLAGLTPGKAEHSPDSALVLAKHMSDATKLVEAYMARGNISAVYRLSAAHASSRLLPASADDAGKLEHRGHFDVVSLVDTVTVEESDALADEDADNPEGSLLAQVPDGIGGGDGTGQGPGGDGDGDGVSGIVIAPEYDARSKSKYPGGPPTPDADTFVLTCEPYDDELPIEELGAAGEEMRKLIATIAQRLEMPTCNYPAHFCLSAYQMIMVRRTQVDARFHTQDVGFFEPLVVSERDSNGAFAFRAVPSVAIQYLQYLAATTPLLYQLQELIHQHSAPRMEYGGWFLHFFEHVIEVADQACGDLYLNACQICLHQLLHASLAAVQDRKNRGDAYVEMFRVLLRSQLTNQVEQIYLSNALASFTDAVGDRTGDDAFSYFRFHTQLAISMSTASGQLGIDPERLRVMQIAFDSGDNRTMSIQLADATNYVFRRGRSAETPVEDAGQIVELEGGGWGIRGSDNKVHTQDELQRSIALHRQVVTAIDPLFSQLQNNFLDSIRPLVDDESLIPGFVSNLLDSIIEKNLDVTQDNLEDTTYAFEHGQINEVSDDPSAPPAVRLPTVPGGRFILSGIHAIAHQLVGESFGGVIYYNNVLDGLLGHELGARELRDDLVVFGSIVLSVICPPLGAAVGVIGGIVTGALDYKHAKEQEEQYGALLNPEDVLSYAQIQAQILSAKLSIGLSFLAAIPEVGSAIKGVGAAGKALAEEGIEATARAVARRVFEQQLEKVAEVCAEKFALGLARELATQAVIGKVLQLVITPFMQAEIDGLKEQLATQMGTHAVTAPPQSADDADDLDDDVDEDQP